MSCLPRAPDVERQKAIITVILEVELVKMLNPPLTPQQRHALMLMLSGTGKTLGEIAEMGKRVIGKKTFGGIAFEHWVSEEDVEISKAKGKCSYCGREWWGVPGAKCPSCFSTRLDAVIEKART